MIVDSDGDPETIRLGDVRNIIDETHESMAANVTVLAHRDVNANGLLDAGVDVLVDQFVTGADGNYYFDLLPDDYIVSLDSTSLDGYVALDDSLTPAGFLQDYQAEWAISSDYFQVWDYDANLEVPLNPVTDAPFAFIDGTGNAVTYGMKDINFLLDLGTPVVPQVEFSGSVTTDFNGDGIFNNNDTLMPGVNVFADVNRNEQFDAGEMLTSTDASGQYSLVVPLTETSLMNVGVIAPIDWTPSDPVSGVATFFTEVGDVFNDVDFSIMPPAFSPGDDILQPGYLLGTVFEDKNEDTLQQSGENGVANVTVYIDANNSGALDPAEITSTTNSLGAFVFADIAPGNYNLRIDLTSNPELEQTSPEFNSPRTITINGNGTVANIEFGVNNGAVLDFGDLPAAYGLTLLSEDGARHPKGVYYLGSRIDSELDGIPTPAADGDDLTLDDDEDGVVVAGLTSGTQVAGATGSLTATASRYGGNLHGWIDFNADFDFDDPGEHIISNHALVFGDNVISFDLPTEIAATGVFARFRYGEFGLGLTGAAAIGEVEDYELFIMAPTIIPEVFEINPDFDEDGRVGGFDFLAWQRGFGTPSAEVVDGDTNGDGAVNGEDLNGWEAAYGTDTNTASAALAPQTGDFNLDGQANGNDFLAWQNGFGIEEGASLSQGDGTQDGNVDASDLSVWAENYGQFGTNSGGGSTSNVPNSFSRGSTSLSTRLENPLGPSSSHASNGQDLSPQHGDQIAQRFALSGTRQLAGLASHWQRHRLVQNSQHLDTIGSGALTRFENHTADTASSRNTELAELGIGSRDQALDHMFAGRQKVGLASYEEVEQEEVAEDVLEFALSEEIDWRVG